MILGMEGPGVIAAYVCTIAATLICVVYGIVNWNKSGENEEREIEEELKWEKKDRELEKTGVSK